MTNTRKMLEQRLGRPIANFSFAVMHGYVKSAQRRGVAMMHTARPFSYYRKVFYNNQSETQVLAELRGKRVVDVGCGYTPFASDSMFRACHDAGIDFYGVDPLLGGEVKFGFRERALARLTGGGGQFDTNPPGLSNALAASAAEMPFEDNSVDEILCSYLLFVWIENEDVLADIFGEFLRVLKPGGVAKVYPLYEWRFMKIHTPGLEQQLGHFSIKQSFVHGGRDWRVTPSMLTTLTKPGN